MNRELEIKNLLQKKLMKFDKQLSGFEVFLFGSRARGEAKSRSDFDIGILGGKSLPIKVFYEIEDEIESLPTLLKFDLVDMFKKSEDFRKEALKKTERLYPL